MILEIKNTAYQSRTNTLLLNVLVLPGTDIYSRVFSWK